jgi:hypothetical protein
MVKWLSHENTKRLYSMQLISLVAEEFQSMMSINFYQRHGLSIRTLGDKKASILRSIG